MFTITPSGKSSPEKEISNEEDMIPAKNKDAKMKYQHVNNED